MALPGDWPTRLCLPRDPEGSCRVSQHGQIPRGSSECNPAWLLQDAFVLILNSISKPRYCVLESSLEQRGVVERTLLCRSGLWQSCMWWILRLLEGSQASRSEREQVPPGTVHLQSFSGKFCAELVNSGGKRHQGLLSADPR